MSEEERPSESTVKLVPTDKSTSPSGEPVRSVDESGRPLVKMPLLRLLAKVSSKDIPDKK